jgi:hypothetical protein
VKNTNKVLYRLLTLVVVISMIVAYILPCVDYVRAVDAFETLYVDPGSGNDNNDGMTLATALKTISAAKVIAAELSELSDVVVYLNGGTYAEGQTITFGQAESGQNGHTITYKALSGETATISGGTRLEGWTLHDAAKNIYVADIPEGSELVRQFYVDGLPMPNASTEGSPTDWTLLSSGGYISPYVNSADSNEYLILDLGEEKQVSKVILYAGNNADATGTAAGFPKDFTISTSVDGDAWDVQVTETDYVAPAIRARVEFVFDAATARYVKIDVTKLGNCERLSINKYNLALTEVVIGMAGTATNINLDLVCSLDMDTNLMTAQNTQIGYYGNTSYANLTDHGTGVENLFDGDYTTYGGNRGLDASWMIFGGGGWTSAFLTTLDKTVSVSAIKLANSAEMVKTTSFEVQISTDGNTWTSVVSKENFDWSAVDYEQVFAFNPAPAKYIRILAHKVEVTAANTCPMQFSEVALYRPADVASGATVTAPNNEIPGSGWGSDLLANGKFDGNYTSRAASSATSIDAPITLDMNESKRISGVRLYPRFRSGSAVHYVTAARFSVSTDGVNYETVLELSGITPPSSGSQLFVFPEAVDARYVRIEPLASTGDPNDSGYRFQLLEIEVAPAVSSGTTNLMTAENTQIGYYGDASYTKLTAHGANVEKLFDGDYSTYGATKGLLSSWMVVGGGAWTSAYLTTLSGTVSVSAIRLATKNVEVLPTSFEVQISTDGSEWTTVVMKEDFNWGAVEYEQVFNFTSASAKYIRILGHKAEHSDGQHHSLQFSEVAMYATTDEINIIPDNVITQGSAGVPDSVYSAVGISAKNDNTAWENNARQAIDGRIEPLKNFGWLVPEKWNFDEISNIQDVEVHYLQYWYHNINFIKGVSADGTEVYATTDGLRPTWLANAYEFIDSVGEWYIDRSEGKLYYKANGTMEDKEAILPVVEEIVRLEGASNIIFDGVVFEHSTYTRPSEIGYHDHQANAFADGGDWQQVPSGVLIDSCENITITNSEIRNMGTAGIKVRSTDSRSNNVSITNCLIHDISYSGIIVGEVYTHSEYESFQLVTNTVIRNNYITRVGIDMYDSPGIVATYTNGTVIDHNEIAYCPYTGISLGWGWDKDNETAAQEVGNNQITNNLVHDSGKTNRDGGSIYNLGSSKDTVISGNYMYNSWDGDDTFENGIYLDQGSGFIEVKNNVIGANVNDWLNQWKDTIHDNYWHDNYYHADLTMRDDSINSVIENNTAVENGNFEAYPEAMEIINNAGLLDENVKGNISIGFAPEHNITQELYPAGGVRYIEGARYWYNVLIEGQRSVTIYDRLAHTVSIVMPAGTDLSALKLTYDCDEGITVDKASGSVLDFTNPVSFTMTDGDETIVWTVTVKLEVLAGGEIVGTNVTLDDAIKNYSKSEWTVAPTTVTADSLTFATGTYSGYIGKDYGTDTIISFDMTAGLYTDRKDWMQISFRNQDPYITCTAPGGAEYNIGFNYDNIEVQKFVDGKRTVLYGAISGFTSIFGTIPNNFVDADVRHSITVGAIDTDAGVRLFMFVDGNLIFDIIDSDNPITSGGFFALYAKTHDMTISTFTDIQRVADITALEEIMESAAALDASKYTESSYAAVVEALEAANNVLAAQGGYTQSMVDDAISALSEAMNGLEEIKSGIVVNNIAGDAVVEAPAEGWVDGTNNFTVSCEEACVVAVSNDNGATYTRLAANATETDGTYSFTAENVNSNTMIVIIKVGDANGDGSCDASDMGRIKGYSLGNVTLSALELLAADANGDGECDAADMGRIKGFTLGKIELSWMGG